MKINPITIAILLWLMPLKATAQEMLEPKSTPDGWAVSIGAGAILSPNYFGDDAYSVSVVPSVRVTHGERLFASVQEGVGYNLVNTKTFRAGPRASLNFGRDEDGSGAFRIAGDRTDDLRGLGDIDTSFSLGGFAELDFGNVTASTNIGQAIGGLVPV